MSKRGQNFKLWAGDGVAQSFDIITETSFYGQNIIFAMSRTPDSEVLATKSADDGTVAVDENIVTVSLAPADTANLSGGRYYYELKIELPAGGYKTLATGHIRIYKSLIKAEGGF